MNLWRFFNISGGYSEPVTSHWNVRVELLGRESVRRKGLSGKLLSKINVLDMSYVTTVNNSLGENNGNYSVTNNSMNGFLKVNGEVSAIFILLYTITTLLAIFGNITAIIVFTKGKRSKTDLRPFLLNLAFADLIMALFCIPFTFTSTLLNNWVFSKPMCPIVVFLQTVSVTASVSTNMAVGIDRFYAITFPLKARFTSSKYKIVIFVIWIFATSLSAVQLKVCRATPASNDSDLLECIEHWDNDNDREVYTLVILFLTYIIPLAILTCTYSIVGCILWRRRTPGNSDIVRDQLQLKAKMKVVKMLVTIVMLFGLCWLPLHTFFLVLDFSNVKNSTFSDKQYILSVVYFVAHWLAMSNSFVNPVIYGLMNDNFRADLRTIIFQIFPCACKSTRARHRVVKRKSRSQNSHEEHMLCNATCHLDLDHSYFPMRTRSQYGRNGNVTKSTYLNVSPSATSF